MNWKCLIQLFGKYLEKFINFPDQSLRKGIIDLYLLSINDFIRIDDTFKENNK